MIQRLIVAEIRKLRGSLALALFFIAPGLFGLLGFIAPFDMERPLLWGEIFGMMTLPLWTAFVLPMSAAALAALFGQIEYRGRAWDHLLSLPIARWKIYAAKAVVMSAMLTIMTAMAFLFAAAGASLSGVIVDLSPVGDFGARTLSVAIANITGSALFLTAILTWAALRFSSFLVPLALGIGGTLVSVAMLMLQTDKADWFPWILPTLTGRYPNEQWYVWYGLAGGLLIFALMTMDLCRREMR